MFSSVESGSSTVPAFLNKLWTLVDDTSTNSLICWDPTGKSFHIYDQGHFAKEILPLYFKHSNIASFIRQLNMYGFRKVVNIEQGGLKTERDDMEFSHPYFQRDQEHLLEFIKRKVNTTVRQETPKVGNTEILKVLSDVRSMKGKQDSLNTNLSDLKRENAALWREVAALRQKHIKQQQIVNKLIQFLVTLVGNNRGLNASMKRKLPLMINDASQLKSSKMQPDFASQLTIEDARDDDFQEENIQTSGPTIKDITYTYNSINTAKMNDTQSQPQTQQQQQPQQSSSHQTLKMDGNVIQFTPEQLQKLAKEGILTIVSDAGPITGVTVSAQSPTSFSSVPSVTTSVQDAKSPPSYAYIKTEKNSPIIQMPKTPQPSASRSSASDVGEISAGQPTASVSAGYSSVLPSGSGSGSSYIPPSTNVATTSDSKTPAVPSDALAINDATSALSRPTVRRQRSLLLSSNDIENQSDISEQLEVLQADLESVKDILTSQGSGIPGLDSGTLFNLFGEDLDLFAGMSSTPGDTNATADSSNFITGNELIQYQGEPDMFDLFGIQESSDPVDPDALASYSASLDTPLLHIPDDVDLLAEAARKATTSTEEVD